MAAPRVLIADLPEQPATVPTDLLVVQNGTTTRKMQIGTLTTASTQPVDAHIADATAAHIAAAIGATPNTAPMSGTDVQTQLGQASAAITAINTNRLLPPNGTYTDIAVSGTGNLWNIVAGAVGQAELATDSVTAVKIVDGSITDAELATMPATTIKGNNTAGTAAPTSLTVAQVTAMLNVFTTTLRGLVPPSNSSSPTMTLRANGTWVEGQQGPQGPAGTPGDWSTPQTIQTVSTPTYTLVAADAGVLKRLTGAGQVITLPPAVLSAGQRVDFVCIGGVASFVLGGGATWDVAPTPTNVARTTGSFVSAVCMSGVSWALTGDLA